MEPEDPVTATIDTVIATEPPALAVPAPTWWEQAMGPIIMWVPPTSKARAKLESCNRNRWAEALNRADLRALCAERWVEGDIFLGGLVKRELADFLRVSGSIYCGL